MNNKEDKKNKSLYFKILIIFVILLVLGYFGYKTYYFQKYTSLLDESYESEYKYDNLDIGSPVVINKKYFDGEYIDGGFVKIKKVFEDYERKDADYILAIKSSEKSIFIHKTDSTGNFDAFVDEAKSSQVIEEDEEITTEDLKNFFVNNNINCMEDYIKYIIKRENKKINIFTPVSKMKEKYKESTIINELSPAFVSEGLYQKITGDLSGYVLTLDNNIGKIFYLYINGESYVIIFNNFLEDEIIDILSTMQIK